MFFEAKTKRMKFFALAISAALIFSVSATDLGFAQNSEVQNETAEIVTESGEQKDQQQENQQDRTASAGDNEQAESATGSTATERDTTYDKCLKLKKATFFVIKDTKDNVGDFADVAIDAEATAKLGTLLKDEKDTFLVDDRGSIVITVTPKAGYELSSIRAYAKAMTVSKLDEGRYQIDTVTEVDSLVMNFAEKTHSYTLESVNSGYGYEDLGENMLYFSAEDGGYVAEVFVNGVSQGAIKNWKISEGDVIKVCYAKEGETWQETEQIESIGRRNYEQSQKTIAGIKATTIKATSSKTSKGKIRIKWTKSAGYSVDYYEIYRSTAKSSVTKGKAFYKTKNGSVKSYLNSKSLKKGKRYYYKVRGVREINGVKYYTKWSNLTYKKA